MTANTASILNSALRTNKTKMDIAMHNIANADNPNYSTKVATVSSIVSGGSPQGVKIQSIQNAYDDVMQKGFFEANSIAASATYISNISKDIMDKIATPGSSNSLYGTMKTFTDKINNLSFDPSNQNLRNDVMNGAKNLADYIGDLGTLLQAKRYESDQNLDKALDEVNSIIMNIQQLNREQMLQGRNTLEYATSQDAINSELEKLSQYFDISYSQDNTGRLHVYLKNNGEEIVGDVLYRFEYKAASSIDAIIADKFNTIYLAAHSLDGQQVNKNIFINSKNSNDLVGGSIFSYMQIRDEILPAITESIDLLAFHIADEFNRLNNQGSNALAQSFTGATLCSLSDKIIGHGHIKVNAMDRDGKPIIGDLGKIPALDLDLGKFSNSGVNGVFTLGSLVDEINNYFTTMSTGTRLDMNGLYMADLAVRSSTVTSIEYDLNVIAYAADPSIESVEISIGNVNVMDSAGNNISSIIKNASNFTISNGAHIRTGVNGGPTIILQKSTINSPYTLTLDITTTVNGLATTATVQYNITSDKINQIFDPQSTNPDTVILSSTSSTPIIKASIVDKNGNPITDITQQGYLKIENTQRNCTIVIDEMDSNIASITNAKLKGGLSGAMGLNNIFSFQEDSKSRAAFMTLSNSFKKNPNAFALGKMTAYRAGELSAQSPGIFFAAGIGNTELIKQYTDLDNKKISFAQTANILDKSSTLLDYAAMIFGIQNSLTINADIAADRANTIKEMLSDALMGVKEVNMDDQTIQMVQLQQQYALAAKGMQITNNLLQTLIDTF